jgi:hypothetical protein
MSTVTISGITRTTGRMGGRRGTRMLDRVRGGATVGTPRVTTGAPGTRAGVSAAAGASQASAVVSGATAGARWTRWIGIGLMGAGIAMVPWLGVLATGLPASYQAANWNAAWVGLDALEALGLFATGTLLRRRDPRAALTAAATSALLCVDALFDVLTSAPADRITAIVMAVGAELPVAALCAALAVRTFPQR